MCRWLDGGTAAHLEEAERAEGRRPSPPGVVLEELGDLHPRGHLASHFTWLPLPEEAQAKRLAATLALDCISVSTAEP